MNSSFTTSPLVSFASVFFLILMIFWWRDFCQIFWMILSSKLKERNKYLMMKDFKLTTMHCVISNLPQCIALQAVDFLMTWNKREVLNRTISGRTIYLGFLVTLFWVLRQHFVRRSVGKFFFSLLLFLIAKHLGLIFFNDRFPSTACMFWHSSSELWKGLR